MITTVAVVGASGKLGSVVCRLVNNSEDFELVAELGSRSDLEQMLVADVVVDVSLPEVSQSVVEFAVSHGKSVLVGTSGWSHTKIKQLDTLLEAHPEVGIIFVPNFSLGSTVASHLAEVAARFFDSIEIIEAHGIHKVDSPSGTAVNTAERISEVRRSDIQARHADQQARGQLVGGIPVHSMRMEGVVAKQEVILGGEGETLAITHTTFSSSSYEAGIMASLRVLSTLQGKIIGLDQIFKL